MNKLLYNNHLSYRFLRHFIFFLFTVFGFTAILFVQNGTGTFGHTLYITFVNSLFFFGYAYITIFLLIPGFLLKQKIVWFILLFLLVGIGLSAIKLVASNQIFYGFISPENIQRTGIMNLRFIVMNTKDMTFIVALFCIAKYVKDYLYTDRLRKKLEIQSKAAQGKLLQAQFDPHFLFNTINNLYALSLLDPVKTKDVIERIKIVLNYIIDESQKNFVVFSDEISLADNYIQLEKLRYGKRLNVELQITGDPEAAKIPSMILFFLIENCFKHGSSPDAGTPWIKINIEASPEQIRLMVVNSKPKSMVKTQNAENSGKGLQNLKQRLDLLYSKNGYSLKIENKENTFAINLELKKTGVELGHETYR